MKMLSEKQIHALMDKAEELRVKEENPNGSAAYNYVSAVYFTLEYVLGYSSDNPLDDWGEDVDIDCDDEGDER